MESQLASSVETRWLYDEAIDLRVGLEVKHRRDYWEKKLGIHETQITSIQDTIETELSETLGTVISSEESTSICDLSNLQLNDIWGTSSTTDISGSTQADLGFSPLAFLVDCFQSKGPFIAKSMIVLVTLLPIVLFFFVINNPRVEQFPVVARVLRQTNYPSWDNKTIPQSDSEIRLGQRFSNSEATTELQTASGVRILLEKNSSIFLTGTNTLYLEYGSLVARVTPEANGFTVRTPDADFVDLGTEFGVNVDPGVASQTKVFKGKIQVETVSQDGEKKQKELHTNQAAKISRNEEIKLIDPTSLAFTTVYPEDRLCLFNLICHTGGYYPDGVWIDPSNGELKIPTESDQVLRNESKSPQISQSEYSMVSAVPVIDGLFTPIPNTETLVNSAGGRFGGVGNQSSRFFTNLLVGKLERTQNWRISDHLKELLAEIGKIKSTLPHEDRAFMAIHANLGVTFDLDVVYRQTGRRVTQFLSMAQNVEGSTTALDFIILADEKPIYEKRDVTFHDGVFSIRVNIPKGTRFLSIICADSADADGHNSAIACDHLMLDSPAFVLENQEIQK